MTTYSFERRASPFELEPELATDAVAPADESRALELERRERQLDQMLEAVEAQRERLVAVREEYERRREQLMTRARELELARNRLRAREAELSYQETRADTLAAAPDDDAPRLRTDDAWWSQQLGTRVDAA